MKTKMILTAIIAMAMSQIAMAVGLPWAKLAENHRCKATNVGYLKGSVVINMGQSQKQPAIYIFHNTSQQTYWINHQASKPSASAGWNSQIAPGHWSAIAMNEPNFAFTCNTASPSASKALDCEQVLHACEIKYPSQLLPTSNYWLAENQDNIHQLKRKINQRLISGQ